MPDSCSEAQSDGTVKRSECPRTWPISETANKSGRRHLRIASRRADSSLRRNRSSIVSKRLSPASSDPLLGACLLNPGVFLQPGSQLGWLVFAYASQLADDVASFSELIGRPLKIGTLVDGRRLAAAVKDSIGANLDRIQIIKGWIDKDGNSQERIYDVAVSDDRTIDADGRCRTPVGNTVSLEDATWSNTIGAPELIEAWTDPDFDPSLAAFYYVRVIEIPTPRWTAYDAKYYGVDLEEGDSGIHQERAYTSPIWYTP